MPLHGYIKQLQTKVKIIIIICDYACINQPLGAKVEFSGRREIANAFTIIPIHFQYLIMPITVEWKVQSKN